MHTTVSITTDDNNTVPAPPARPHRIDVHSHIIPPAYVSAMGKQAVGSPSASGRIPPWTPEQALETMDRNGIATAMTSISCPGVTMEDRAATQRLARLCNEYATQLGSDHPGRFGTFATLPIPDVNASQAEIDYALDVLKADGIVLLTNYAGRYLGDDFFIPFLQHLNERQAVVFVHPTLCGCPNCHPAVSASTLEFPFDTARTIVSLLYTRSFSKYPNLRFIFSHAGGAMPFLATRLVNLSLKNPHVQAGGPLDVYGELRRLYFDTALSASRSVFACLRELVPIENILFGTDYPFAPEAHVKTTVEGLADAVPNELERIGIERANALALFPSLQPGVAASGR